MIARRAFVARSRFSRSAFALASVASFVVLTSSALPFLAIANAATLDPATAEADVTRARADGNDAFCKKPTLPLSKRARALCGLANDVKNCQALVDACKAADALSPTKDEPKKETDKPKIGETLAAILGGLAQIAVWLLVAAVIVAIAIPVIQAIAKARRDKRVAEPLPAIAPAAVATPQMAELESVSDAELLLRRAEEHMRRGELDRATVTYLNAALRALDQRGAIRIARHRTNGEYVRGCKEADAKRPLREIVREVDRVQFGGEHPTEEAARTVASRAAALVRSLPMAVFCIALVSILGGCQPGGRGPGLREADPAGDDLMMDLLKRQGMTVARMHGSLATLPMPKAEEPSPAVIVDVERTPLEDDTRAHLAHWVEAGGVLILAGNPDQWPAPLEAKWKTGTSTDVTVAVPDTSDDENEENEDLTHFEHAKIARPGAFTWGKGAYELATLKSGEMYAATHTHGQGLVLGIANDDLFTNAALSHAGNAAALVALFAVADRTHDFKVANPEDGISPPTNPISALHRAGLGHALWHALAAAIILFLAVGIRQARPKATPPPTRRAFAEHVEATGALYARTRIASHALAVYARYADERLRAKMPRGTHDPAAFLASRANVDPAHAAAIWARAIAARSNDAPRGDELVVLRELSTLYANATKSE